MPPTNNTRQALLDDLQNLSEELDKLARPGAGKGDAASAILSDQIDMLNSLANLPTQATDSLLEQIDQVEQLLNQGEHTDTAGLNAQLDDLLQTIAH